MPNTDMFVWIIGNIDTIVARDHSTQSHVNHFTCATYGEPPGIATVACRLRISWTGRTRGRVRGNSGQGGRPFGTADPHEV